MNETNTNPTESEHAAAELVYQRWLKAVTSLNVESVLSLYADDAVLWGTMATKTKVGRERVREYFDWFLDRASLAASPITSEFHTLSPDIVSANGSYHFGLGGKGSGDPVAETEARFTFVFRKNPASGDWEIVDHHSSLFPPEDASPH